MSKPDQPAIGVPYNYGANPYQAGMAPQGPPHYAGANPYQAGMAPPGASYYVGMNPYQAGMIPPNAIYGDPKGIPIEQTMYRDTPAPFNCPHCGETGLTNIKAKRSLASVVACIMPFGVGICFLLPSHNCLWHKYHYCPSCHQKVADFEKSDPCLVVDQPQWYQDSFAVPA